MSSNDLKFSHNSRRPSLDCAFQTNKEVGLGDGHSNTQIAMPNETLLLVLKLVRYLCLAPHLFYILIETRSRKKSYFNWHLKNNYCYLKIVPSKLLLLDKMHQIQRQHHWLRVIFYSDIPNSTFIFSVFRNYLVPFCVLDQEKHISLYKHGLRCLVFLSVCVCLPHKEV